LRPLDHRARRVIGLFATQQFIQSTDVANLLGISTRQARELLSVWTEHGWLVIADPSRKGRKYRLAQVYQKII
jgi:predicted transcriptional regulator of viral defense system